MDNNIATGAKLAALSVGTSLASVPLEDATQLGQIISASLVKLFKKKK